ncbi:MAG: spinster family MFS transporter [Alphaproteobacteria bacterium]
MQQPAQTGEAPYASPARAWYLIGVLVLAYTFSFIDRQILGLLVTPIKRDLGISDFEVGLLGGLAFALFYTFLGLPIGRLADRANRRNIIVAGIVVWSLMTAACGLAKNFWTLFLARMGVGVGEAALSPPAYSLIADTFPPDKLARALSVYSMGIFIGSALAYIVGAGVVQAVDTAPPVTIPVFGEIHAWQLTFFIVGLPGILVALLMLTVREPARRGVLKTKRADGTEGIDSLPLRDVLAFVRKNGKTYGAHFVSFALLAVFGYGTALWIPEFIRRSYGWEIYDAGYAYGFIILIFGIGGVFFGGWFCDWMRARGRTDANMRGTMMAAVALAPCAILFPLAGSVEIALVVLAGAVFFGAMPTGAAAAALQAVTPNQMRAQVSALYLFTVNLIGMGVGPGLVGFFTDFVFGDTNQLYLSLVLTAAITIPPAALLLAWGLKHYRKSLAENDARIEAAAAATAPA